MGIASVDSEADGRAGFGLPFLFLGRWEGRMPVFRKRDSVISGLSRNTMVFFGWYLRMLDG